MPIYKDVSSLELVTYTFANGFTFAGGGNLFADGVDFILEKLDAIPEADVEPVRHGHWITEKDPFGTVCRYTCSCCGEHWTPINGVHWLRFCGRCPNGNCGAKMDEEGE